MRQSRILLKRAEKVIPSGVNSPVRAFNAVGNKPPFIESGKGCRVRDADGNSYIDYLASWGPLILGHAHPEIVKAVTRAAKRGTTFGAATAKEVELAEIISECIPSIEQCRLVSSGTEAVMSAVRLARAYTGRERIIKFVGGYHGHADSFLVSAGSGLATFGKPSSPGVPKELAKLTGVLKYNDIPGIHKYMKKYGKQIAAIVVEPVAANMGVIPPKIGFLEVLRILSNEYGATLIFDEVVSGFRLGLSGAQGMYGVTPDLTCLGKIIGGGLPLAAFGGNKKIMKYLSPNGPVYQAGTLSGNPLAVASGIATLNVLRRKPPYENLDKMAGQVIQGISKTLANKNIPHRVNRIGSMMTLFFTKNEVTHFNDAAKCNAKRFARFHQAMMKAGIYLPPSQFESWFVSTAHTPAIIKETVRRAVKALAKFK